MDIMPLEPCFSHSTLRKNDKFVNKTSGIPVDDCPPLPPQLVSVLLDKPWCVNGGRLGECEKAQEWSKRLLNRLLD